jgi:hypothetical protein
MTPQTPQAALAEALPPGMPERNEYADYQAERLAAAGYVIVNADEYAALHRMRDAILAAIAAPAAEPDYIREVVGNGNDTMTATLASGARVVLTGDEFLAWPRPAAEPEGEGA